MHFGVCQLRFVKIWGFVINAKCNQHCSLQVLLCGHQNPLQIIIPIQPSSPYTIELHDLIFSVLTPHPTPMSNYYLTKFITFGACLKLHVAGWDFCPFEDFCKSFTDICFVLTFGVHKYLGWLIYKCAILNTKRPPRLLHLLNKVVLATAFCRRYCQRLSKFDCWNV